MISGRLKKRIFTISRIIGFFSMGFSLSLIFPILVSLWYDDHEAIHFFNAFLLMFIPGSLLWYSIRNKAIDLTVRDGFLVVTIFWTWISLLASWPLILGAHLSYTDAIFESISAITILPMIGIGGMQLYKAEAPGPFKEQKITPRLSKTARSLWGIYVVITLLNTLAYWLAGMSPFDAVSHSLSTISTGGFSTHDASLGYFHSPLIESIAIIFMLLGGINFSIHYLALHRGGIKSYWEDIEVRSFLLFVLAVVVFSSLLLYLQGTYHSVSASFENACFEVVSIVTSTGFGTADFSQWPGALPVLLIFISFVGGCGGSTAGGMKVIRMNVIFQQGIREIRRLIHPHAQYPIRVGRQLLDERTVEAVWGFMAMYVATFVILMLLMMQTGLDQVTAFSAITTSMNNLGPGLGDVTTTFASVSDPGKVIAMIAMLLGRPEVFTVLVLLTPEFWKQ